MSKTQYTTVTTIIDKHKYDERRIQKLQGRELDLNMHANEGFAVISTITIDEVDDLMIVDTLSRTTTD